MSSTAASAASAASAGGASSSSAAAATLQSDTSLWLHNKLGEILNCFAKYRAREVRKSHA